MMDNDLDDTHLCIKCSVTIVGLDNYIKHRKTDCAARVQHNQREKPNENIEENRRVDNDNDADADDNDNVISASGRAHLDHTYDAFSYHEPEAPTTYVNKSQHGGKSTKSFTDAYELPYDLNADVFFSSLQLQSVQSTAPSTSGKSGSTITHNSAIQRQKQEQEGGKVGWISHHGTQRNSERLMKAFSEIGDVKPSYEHIFKPIDFVHDSPELSEDDAEDEDEELHEVVDDDDDEDYESLAVATHGSGGKWKSSPLMRHSPPVVPANHTGGKWKPENRPHLRVSHTQISRLSPTWDEHLDDVDAPGTPDGQQQHPPADHTKGKWVPGTKMQRLEYKEVLLVAKKAKEDYWCNICCRRLKNRANYEHHLKTGYHLKRAEPEQQLEKAALEQLKPADIKKFFESTSIANVEVATLKTKKKRFRRATYIRCDLCKHVMQRHLIGKHLISHYHYRRTHVNVGKSLHMILDNIHSIVLQSPYQCRPCRFYANTEEAFLWHWNSATHLDTSEGAGKFFCSYCQYECEDNNQMRRHLLSSEHKEVILAINRSVPISISKKLNINCSKCGQSFRYNAELRSHSRREHPGEKITGTASDIYQSRFKCDICGECCRSQVSLQRHEKSKHSIFKFFCSICNLEFGTPCQARRHRKTLEHRKQAALSTNYNWKKGKQAKTSDNPMKCSKCDFISKSEVEAVLHELSHSKSIPAKKVEQVKVIKENPRLLKKAKKHIRKLKISNSLKCRDCIEIFVTKAELKEHRDRQHTLLRHLCPCCGESFITAQALGRHTRLCRPTNAANLELQLLDLKNTDTMKRWFCDQCEFSSSYESELIYHRLHHTHGLLGKNELIKCPLCMKLFRKYSLRCHLRQHTNEKIFECEFCKLKFSRRHNLKDHINKQHKLPADSEEDKHKTLANGINTEEKYKQSSVSNAKEQRFPCDICDMRFTTKHNLKQHKFIKHGMGQADFSCAYKDCHFAAVNQAALKIHISSHARESLNCDHPECKYIGKSLMHLMRHRRSHVAPTKLFSCDLCNFKARTQVHIRRHMGTHLDKKPHQCPHCDFKCSSFDNLRKHILKTNKHPGKFIYECQQCQELAKQQQRIGDTLKKEQNNEFQIYKTNSFKELQQHLSNEHKS